ncbi:hypothetical protein JHK87_021892 [Glycine soja]|nr:hypothetical protein JHK87_021892 [Glycine soja]
MKEASVEGPESSHMDIMEASKADIFCGHSERLAIVFGLINSGPGMPIWVTKNLYMCQSCHNIVKFISREVRREISVRDAEQFHHFKGGIFSCKDEASDALCSSSKSTICSLCKGVLGLTPGKYRT